jgi:predicted RNA-binding protein with PIN domain
MDNQTLRNIQQNLTAVNVRPVYADEAVVAHTIKSGKDQKGKITKEAHIHLVFIDMTTQKPVDKVVISPITARGLYNALADSLSKVEKELKSKKVDKQKTETADYIR